MRNQEVARILGDIADLLEIKGESAFRVGAYREAARRIEGLSLDIEMLSAQGKLREIQGIGGSLAARIDEYLRVGRVQYLDDLRAAIPSGLVELLQIPGLGPKKVKLVYEKLGVTGLDDLEKAVHEHRLQTLPGMGEKSEEKLLVELERWRNRSRRILLGNALPRAEAVAEMLQGCPAVQRVEPSGSIRRRQETIGDIDILASSDSPDEVMACFNTLPIVKEVIAHGTTKSSVLTVDDLQIDLRVVKPESFGAALQYFTGSKNHNVKLRELAQKRGLKINEYGIFE
ncbi:MAG: helix-hairpin-helix domain-containing protein, partial [Chloroflexi bacterium]|nr:helix-hairpin-helix domain-containing protein [Chloroflexota bacterium]